MAEQIIVCPHCGKKIPLSEAISHQLREELTRDFEKDAEKALKEKIKKLEKKAQRKAQDAVDTELKDLKEEVSEKNRKLDGVQKVELELNALTAGTGENPE